jgi:hypothetical protein
VRRRWVRPYLRWYPRLAEDDQCPVLENSLLLHHFTTREEELFEVDVVSFECLVTLLHQVLKVGMMMLFLSRSDPLVPEFPPFMLDVLEVVDSPMELPKCVCTQNKQESEAPAQSKENWTIQFQELDSPVLSRPMTVRGDVEL